MGRKNVPLAAAFKSFVITYPDSNKWFVKPHRKCFTIQQIDDYADEE